MINYDTEKSINNNDDKIDFKRKKHYTFVKKISLWFSRANDFLVVYSVFIWKLWRKWSNSMHGRDVWSEQRQNKSQFRVIENSKEQNFAFSIKHTNFNFVSIQFK